MWWRLELPDSEDVGVFVDVTGVVVLGVKSFPRRGLVPLTRTGPSVQSRSGTTSLTTTMTPNPVHNLSVEQLISALHEELSTKCMILESTTPPGSRALAAALAAKVRPN